MEEIGEFIRELDKVIHEKTRLGILIILHKRGKVSFKYLKYMLKLSDGNLATHLKTLKNKGYIKIEKKFVAGKPHTEYKLAERGEKQLERYIHNMEKIMETFKGEES